MAVAYLLIILLVAFPVIHAMRHDVGGNNGWSEETDLAAWASTQLFTVGDTIVFLYNGHYRLDIVSEDDYNTCNHADPLKSYSNGITTITIDKVGPMYFIDPTSRHCQAGMKLAIDVHTEGGGSRSSPGEDAMSPPGMPSWSVGGYPMKPIGYMIPKPDGAAVTKLSNGLYFGFSLVLILLMA